MIAQSIRNKSQFIETNLDQLGSSLGSSALDNFPDQLRLPADWRSHLEVRNLEFLKIEVSKLEFIRYLFGLIRQFEAKWIGQTEPMTQSRARTIRIDLPMKSKPWNMPIVKWFPKGFQLVPFESLKSRSYQGLTGESKCFQDRNRIISNRMIAFWQPNLALEQTETKRSLF